MRIKAEDLSKSYPAPGEPLRILDQLQLEVKEGDSLAIMGPSGCGKSTLLHILGTLENPDSGTLELGETNPFSLAESELAGFRNREIGFIFQDHYLLPQCTVLENTLLPLMVSSGDPEEGEARAKDLLGRVGLLDRAGHKPSELSGGERQRAAIARALINSPGLLLCDEPTGNLDGQTASRVGDLLVEIQESVTATIVVVTHSEELASRFNRQLLFSGKTLEEA